MLLSLREIDWKELEPWQFWGWFGFFSAVILYLLANFNDATLLDNVHLPIHEGGHLLFSYLGYYPMLWGGFLFQLLVPVLLWAGFAVRRELPGAAFSSFAFCHSALGVARYMSDSIRMELPLVTVGGGEAKHDFNTIFTDLGLLAYSEKIGAMVKGLAWIGIFATLAWYWWAYRQQQAWAAEMAGGVAVAAPAKSIARAADPDQR